MDQVRFIHFNSHLFSAFYNAYRYTIHIRFTEQKVFACLSLHLTYVIPDRDIFPKQWVNIFHYFMLLNQSLFYKSLC